jgi:hypothetical protein
MNDVRMSGLDGDTSDDAQGLGGGGNGDGGGGVGGVSLGTRKEGRQSDRVVKTTGRVGRERVTRYGGVR